MLPTDKVCFFGGGGFPEKLLEAHRIFLCVYSTNSKVTLTNWELNFVKLRLEQASSQLDYVDTRRNIPGWGVGLSPDVIGTPTLNE